MTEAVISKKNVNQLIDLKLQGDDWAKLFIIQLEELVMRNVRYIFIFEIYMFLFTILVRNQKNKGG